MRTQKKVDLIREVQNNKDFNFESTALSENKKMVMKKDSTS